MTEIHVLGDGKWFKKQAEKRLKNRRIQHKLAYKWLKEKGLWNDLKIADIKVGDHVVVPCIGTDKMLDLMIEQVEYKEFKNQVKHLICTCDRGVKMTFAWCDETEKYISPEFVHRDEKGTRYIVPDYKKYYPCYETDERHDLQLRYKEIMEDKNLSDEEKQAKLQDLDKELNELKEKEDKANLMGKLKARHLIFWVNGDYQEKRGKFKEWLISHFPKLFKRSVCLCNNEISRFVIFLEPQDPRGSLPEA